MRFILYVFLILIIFKENIFTMCFNMDPFNCIKHTGEKGSWFGYSVAHHELGGQGWVLVGAPKANTSQPGVIEGGAVYRCDIKRSGRCTEIVFDNTGNNIYRLKNGTEYERDIKSNQWFGASVRSSGEDGRVAACAPRYQNKSSHDDKEPGPVGTCFVSDKDFSKFTEYSPCRTFNSGISGTGSCQAGFSIDFSKDGGRIFIGGVSSWYLQGRRQLRRVYKEPDVISTMDGSKLFDDSYLGYSMVTGDFGGQNGQTDVAVGMPRGTYLLGKVILYRWNMTVLHNIDGKQIGAYFGYSLCSIDINGDNRDDLVIGAPFYTDFKNTKGSYENGRVYFVYQKYQNFNVSLWDERDGVYSKGRFGLAIAALGDINKDGFGDVAIGAPYDGEQGLGSVYIYLGSAKGIRNKYSQVIKAEQISSKISTFGFSLSGGFDLDKNSFPDLIVGSYASDTSVLIRARPVIKMYASVKLEIKSKRITLEEKNCTLNKTKIDVLCITLRACLLYNGTGITHESLGFDVNFILDSRKPNSPRMFFFSHIEERDLNVKMELKKNVESCHSEITYIKSDVRDKLTPLEVEMSYNLKEEKKGTSYCDERYMQSLFPILDSSERLLEKDSIAIQINCLKNDNCQQELRVRLFANESLYKFGTNENINIDIQVKNHGDDGYEAILSMLVPRGLNYVDTKSYQSEKDGQVECFLQNPSNDSVFWFCNIGNPLPAGKSVHLNVEFQPVFVYEYNMEPQYTFFITVNSTNPKNNTSVLNDSDKISVAISAEADILLTGTSKQESVYCNYSLYETTNSIAIEEADIGPEVIHAYHIKNKGPADVIEAEMVFFWPSFHIESNNHLLYLLEQPRTTGPIECEFVENVYNKRLKEKRKLQSSCSSLQNTINSGKQSEARITSQLGIEIPPSVHRDNKPSRYNMYTNAKGLSNCSKSANCIKIKCTLRCLVHNQEASVDFRSRFWARSVSMKAEDFTEIQATSEVYARIIRLPLVNSHSENNIYVHSVATKIYPVRSKGRIIKLRLLILAVCIGIIAFTLLCCILRRYGFFERNRPLGYDAGSDQRDNMSDVNITAILSRIGRFIVTSSLKCKDCFKRDGPETYTVKITNSVDLSN
ncbi:integrin alpha-PS2-like isoform X2 [Lycorma delicatula]|uniref:integrin alpha-PS2-like isoform X2 n=1 Tax=Lycorma delicatula TaxID=130591 RepID=UPI003F515BFD